MARTLSQPLLFGAAYFIAAALPIWATRLDGGVAFLWIASALLTAKLRTIPREAWRPWLFAAAVASMLATGLVGLGWMAAPALIVFNLLDALIAEKVLRSIEERRGPFLMERDGLLLVLACLAGALVTAFPAATVAHLVTGTSIASNAWSWIISHTLGSLTFGPFMALCMRGRMLPWLVSVAKGRDLPALTYVLGLAATTVLTFQHDTFSLLFLPVLVLVLLTYQAGLPGTAFGNLILAFVAAVSLLLGKGSAEFGSQAATFQFLLFFLGMTTLVMLPVSAVVSNRREMLERVQTSEDGYRMLADNIEDVVICCDAEGRLTYVSPSIRNLGRSPESVIGQTVFALVDPRYHDAAHKAWSRIIAAQADPVTFEFVGLASGDQDSWFEMRVRSVAGGPGEPVRIIGTIRETTRRKTLESALASAAETDGLTGLLNRRAFLGAAGSVAASGNSNWLALFDLDHVNAINRFVGHDAGDLVLKTFAGEAQRAVRDDDLLGRIEDDAFGLLLPNTSAEDAELVCQRVLNAFAAARIACGGRPVVVSASAGLTPLQGDLEASVSAARSALSSAKTAGGAKLSIAA